MLRSPIGGAGTRARQEEVAQSLEAISGAAQISGRPWADAQSALLRRRRRDGGALSLDFILVLMQIRRYLAAPYCMRIGPS